MSGRKYPFQPLLELDCYRQASSRDLARLFGNGDSTIRKWRVGGIPEYAADFFACRAGYHPGLVWPEWWQS